MTEKCERQSLEKFDHNIRAIRPDAVTNTQLPERKTMDTQKALELDRQLTRLGFPDGRPLRDLYAKNTTGPDDHLHDHGPGENAARQVRDSQTRLKDETWELVHPLDEKFVPILKPDPRDWSPLVMKGNYNTWAERSAAEYGLRDYNPSGSQLPNRDVNAYRHAATAAIFTLKYGPNTALLLGTINEFVAEAGAFLQGRMNEKEIADCNADLLNNRFGINIARRLLGNRDVRENITLKVVTDEVVRELKAGMLITDPLKEWRRGNLAPEIKLLVDNSDK